MFRPNIEEVRIIGDQVVVQGVSEEADDLASIRVILAQGGNTGEGSGVVLDEDDTERVRRGRVGALDDLWQAEIPLGSFTAGPAVSFGIEQRKINFLTLTWAEPVTIIK